MSGAEPILAGAAIGAAGSAITGNNPFKGALLGAAGGGMYSAWAPAAAGSAAGATSATGMTASELAATHGAAVAPGMEAMGLVPTSYGTYVDPTSFIGEGLLSTPIYTGNGPFMEQLVTGVRSVGGQLTDGLSGLSPTDAMSIGRFAMSSPEGATAPTPVASGSVRRGSPPQMVSARGTALTGLPQPRRRARRGLLGA